MLRSCIARKMRNEIEEALKEGSTMGIAKVRGKIEVYYEYNEITVHELHELLDIAINAVSELLSKGASPYLII